LKNIKKFLIINKGSSGFINNLVRESKSSRRVYKSAKDVEKVCGGFGSAIYSTSKGILCDKECRRLKIGGELICTVS
jgi:small subunit ribosomal protein S8